MRPGTARCYRPSVFALALLSALLVAALPEAAHADRFVATTGSDAGNDCTNPASPCATIANAIAQASPGEVVTVGAGTFPGSLSVTKPLTLRGAQAGVPIASRTAGSAGETILDARGLASAIHVGSSDVVVEGFDIVGDAATYAGIVLYANADITNVAIRDNFIHGMALANPNASFTQFAYGVFGVTGTLGNRKQISGLVVQGNDIYGLGAAGSVAGAAVYLHNVAGATPGDGATISGNRFRDLATRDTVLNVGAGVVIDAGADDFLGLPIAPSSGVALSGNLYVNSDVGAALIAASSSFSETAASFANVKAIAINIGRQTTIDVATLGRYVFTGSLVAFADSDGYFATIQAAVDASTPAAEVRATAGTFPETVTLTRGIQLLGPRAGEDARTRDPLLGEATITRGIRIRAEGATVDGVTVGNPGGAAIHADQTATTATVRNTRVDGATRGIALDRAQNATVTGSFVKNVTDDAICAGTDSGTQSPLDDVPSIALIESNESVGAKVGVQGYLQFSVVRGNVFRDNPSLELGAGIAGALIDSVVEMNTVSGYERGAGVLLTGSPNRPLTHHTLFRCNSFLDNYFGILIEVTQTTTEGILVRGNTISGNTIGALNYPAVALDATNNWWGCAGGPGTPGCDVAGQNVTFTPFLPIEPECGTCLVDEECDDALFCNGPESCDVIIGQCLPGTPPTCDLGGADPQCNVAACDETFGCVAIPISDGTVCDLGTLCSVSDTCVSGACVAGPGAGDADGDGICDADDTCSDCGFPLVIDRARLIANRGRARDNGKVVVKASFIAPPGSGEELDVSAPIIIQVRDGGSLAVDAPFQLGECKERRGIVTCRSTDRRYNMRVKPFRPRAGTGKQIVTFSLNQLDIGPSFTPPVTVQLRHGAGIVRTGSIATCKTAPGALRCNP